MNQPLISVVIPVFNEEARIARALRSIQDQTYKNLEIIVVDDGSTDATRTVVEKIIQEDARVSLHKNPDLVPRTNWRGYDINAGYAARNFGFQIAKGEWLTTQDADDASLLNRIETQFELAKKYSATCVTVQWQELTEATLHKQLDVEQIFKDKGENFVVIQPETINKLAKAVRGPLMLEPLHQWIPFSIKWFPYTRKLFYRQMDSYPGSDNAMFFHKKVRDDGVLMRSRNKRTWGVPSGRGSGRDFAFHIAHTYKNSWSFKLPMYLWDVKSQNPGYSGFDIYLR